jgi:hypothetical protein
LPSSTGRPARRKRWISSTPRFSSSKGPSTREHDLSDEISPGFETPTLEKGVPGPRNEIGLLLRAPRREELVWDIEAEIVSARRHWQVERQAWWIAGSYFDTVVALVLRSFPSVLILDEEEDRLLSRDGVSALQGRLL